MTCYEWSRMITISDPLHGSKEGYRTLHEILSDGKRIGRVEVDYLQRDEVKTFKRLKRKLKVGQPFNVRVTLAAEEEPDTEDTLGSDALLGVVKAVAGAFNGLELRDIFVVKETRSGTNYLGRGSSLQQEG